MNKLCVSILIFLCAISFRSYSHPDEDRKNINEVESSLIEKARKFVIENNLLNFNDKNYEVSLIESEHHWIVFYKEIVPGIDIVGGTPELYFSKETGEIETIILGQ